MPVLVLTKAVPATTCEADDFADLSFLSRGEDLPWEEFERELQVHGRTARLTASERIWARFHVTRELRDFMSLYSPDLLAQARQAREMHDRPLSLGLEFKLFYVVRTEGAVSQLDWSPLLFLSSSTECALVVHG